MMRIAVFASHNGSAARALQGAAREGKLDASLCLVLTGNSNAGVLRWAKAEGIRSALINARTHPDPEARTQALLEALSESQPDLIFLSGYMQKIPSLIIKKYAPALLNIHPALLPHFGGKGMYGRHVHEAVLRSGVKKTGATIHIVHEDYDTGPIVAQKEVEILPQDTPQTLEARVKACEHRLVLETFKKISESTINLAMLS